MLHRTEQRYHIQQCPICKYHCCEAQTSSSDKYLCFNTAQALMLSVFAAGRQALQYHKEKNAILSLHTSVGLHKISNLNVSHWVQTYDWIILQSFH